MRTRFLFFFPLLMLWPFFLSAQSHKHAFDSLVGEIKNTKEDTSRVKLFVAICREASYFDPDTAIAWSRKGLELSGRLHDRKGTAAFYSTLATGNINLAEYSLALDYLYKAIAIYDSLGDQKNKARSLMNTGNVFYFQKDYLRAAEMHLEAMALYDSIGVRKGVGDCAMNLGNDYSDNGELEKGIDYYNISMRIRDEMKDLPGKAQALNNMAQCFVDLKQYDQAEKYFLQSLALKREVADSFGVANTLLGLGNLELEQKHYDKAISWAVECEKISQLTGNNRVRRLVYELLAEANYGKGNYKEAYDQYNRFFGLHDSLYNQEKTRSMEEMEARYQNEKKKRENESLKQQNQIQALESQQKDAEINRQWIIIGSVAAGLILLLVLLVFIFKGYNDKKRANEIISIQKKEVERQRDIVEEKQTEILDSIHYARRIQRALLASELMLKKYLPEHFVLYKPKDIVSGDFYWASQFQPGKVLLLTGDCTGHGVPGAFMSLLNITLLNGIVSEHRITRPDDVLNEVRRDIIQALNAEGTVEMSRDGMDCVLCSFDFSAGKLSFACANNPLWILRDGELLEFKPDKQPVGYYDGESRPFSLQQADLKTGDIVYSFTDGFADQFGGPKGKKFKYSQLKEKLIALSSLPMQEQKEELERIFDSWKGNLEQVDDVLVIGVRV